MLSSRSIMVDTGPKWATACAIEVPHLVADRMVVGVDDVALLVAMTGHMELHDAVARHAVQEIVGGEAVIEGADIDVVDVEQEPAIGARRDLAHELPFGHLRLAEGDVARHVLERQPAAEEVLHLADALDHVVERLLGVGDGQKVVQVHAVHAGPAQMIGDPFGVDALGEPLQRAEIVHVERRGRGDRQRHAVHDDRDSARGSGRACARAGRPRSCSSRR